MHPHYHSVTFDPDTHPYGAITVKLILDEAHKVHKWAHVLADEPEAQRENFQLRYITDEERAFSLAGLSDHDAVLEKAGDWYNSGGHHLSSTCIGPDESTLLETVVPTPNSLVVRLYVIVAPDDIPVLSDTHAPPLLAKRRMFIERSQALLASDDESLSDDDHSPSLGSWATIYESVFAYATLSLDGFFPVHADVRALDENYEVIDGKAFDIRICAYDLCETLRCTETLDSGTQLEALKGLLRDLFDDPALQVNFKQVTDDEGRVLSTELEIIGECHTAHLLPAPYIMGKDMLISYRWRVGGEGQGFDVYKQAVVGPKYSAVREMTCCPCLIIEMDNRCVHFYTAYFSDEVHRVHLCAIPLVDASWSDGAPGEYSNTFKLQVIRKTAQELRRAYARVHTGSAIPNAPHLYPRFASLMAAPLPTPLTLIDRAPVSPYALPLDPFRSRAPLLFTGVMQRIGGSPMPVHVKFISDREYGVAAHRLLMKYELEPSDSDADSDTDSGEGTSWPLAPVFLHRMLFPGTHTHMIVMETLAGDTLEHLLATGAPVSEDDLADIRTAVAVLHQHGFVHGDIRPSNVLVQREPEEEEEEEEEGEGEEEGDGPASTRARAYLLDFDWAGKAGKAKYPVPLDERLDWPRPMWELRGRYITKRDDLVMLRKMLALVREREGRGCDIQGAEGLEKQKKTADTGCDEDGSDGDDNDQDEDDQASAMFSEPDDDGEDDNPWSAVIPREKVVDFGRAWKAHGGVYPVNINPRLKWPRPAEELRCQPITRAHDLFMFEELLKELRGGEPEEDAEDDAGEDAGDLKRKFEERSIRTSDEPDEPKRRKPNHGEDSD